MKKISTVAFLSTLLHFSGFSQLLSGRVMDSQQHPLQGVSIRAYKSPKDIIQSFAITDSKGQFRFDKPFLSDTIKLVVASMGFATQERIIKKNNLIQDFILTPQAIELKEVIVKTPPVRISHDTIAYDIKQFGNNTDRSLGDVLKKLPGIELSENGTIKYNGEPINKYYTEGKDLFEGKYKIANDNFRWQDIERVEILENHQPISVLKDIVYSPKAGMNVIFKESVKAKWIKTAHFGGGFDEENVLYDNSLNLIKITKNNQSFSVIKNNNVGTDLLSSTQSLTIEDLIDVSPQYLFQKVLHPLLSIIEFSKPPVNQKYLNFNQSRLFTSKNLWTLKKKYDIVLNIEYLKDKQANQGWLESRYFLGNDTLLVTEKQNNIKNINQLEGTLSTIANQPNYYFSNKLFVKAGWQNAEGILENDNLGKTQNINQQNQYDTQWISDELKIQQKSASGNIIEFKALGYYLNSPQNLNVLSNNQTLKQNTLQDLRLRKSFFSFYTNFLANKKLKLNTKIGAEYSDQSLFSNLSGFSSAKLIGDSSLLSNNQSLSYWRVFGEMGYTVNKENLKINFALPVSSINWLNLEKNRFVIEPNLSMTYIFSAKWSTTFKYNFKYNIAEIDDFYKSFLLTNYRNIERNVGQIPDNQRHSVSLRLNFKNMIHFWFMNAVIGFGEVQSNLLKEQTNDGIYIKQVRIASDNTTQNFNGFLQTSKYFHTIKTKLTISNSNEVRNSVRLFSNNQPAKIENKSNIIALIINSNPKKWLRLQFDVNAIHSSNSVKTETLNTRNTFEQLNFKTKIDFLPSPNLTFGIEANKYQIDDEQNQLQRYFLMDCVANYHFKKGNVDLSLFFQNLTNEMNFQTLSFSDNSFISTNFRLRPRQIWTKLIFTL
ncbi:carboxypeptidase-like regulatory domain-containing protein [Flectobacillus major]|uniref:carboxypeptidase-like regulatory domain-containing protein n=1 Tax=Flectobacillus major TaxID=103 RepID=UPI00040C3DF9|nr:carboxypeptidase-like regulatory domain-containing protein [Flectobacillus major]